VAPRPASGEGASLYVGPESDWRFYCSSCAHVDAITAGPSMATPTAMLVPTADWPVSFNVTVGPCVGCLESLHWF
jgi:hypothetical protein